MSPRSVPGTTTQRRRRPQRVSIGFRSDIGAREEEEEDERTDLKSPPPTQPKIFLLSLSSCPPSTSSEPANTGGEAELKNDGSVNACISDAFVPSSMLPDEERYDSRLGGGWNPLQTMKASANDRTSEEEAISEWEIRRERKRDTRETHHHFPPSNSSVS